MYLVFDMFSDSLLHRSHTSILLINSVLNFISCSATIWFQEFFMFGNVLDKVVSSAYIMNEKYVLAHVIDVD